MMSCAFLPGKRKGKIISRSLVVCSFCVLGLIWCYGTVISVLEIHSIDSHDAYSGLPQSGNSNSISKAQFLNNDDTRRFAGNTDQTKVTAGFIHMGKTGGSTLSLLLRYGCHSFLRPKHKQPCRVVPNETLTSKLVHTYYHIPDFHKLPKSKHQIYIMTTRDVFDRTVSAFLYNHPQNIPYYEDATITDEEIEQGKILYKCFPSLEAFASVLNRGNSTECNYPYRHNVVDNTNCSELACAAIHGKVRPFIHLFFNYRNIYSKIPSQPPIPRRLFVIRKEKLWEDWFTIDDMLRNEMEPKNLNSSQQSTQRLFSSVRNERNITGIKLPVTRDITDARRQQLCKTLELEYRVYFQILQKAENIGSEDINDAKTFAELNCGNLDFESMMAPPLN